MPKNITLNNCDDKLADLIYDLVAANESHLKLRVGISFSGTPNKFAYKTEEVETRKFFELLRNGNNKSEKEANGLIGNH